MTTTTEQDDGSGIDWQAYQAPAAPAGAVAAICAAVERGGPAVAPETRRRVAWMAAGAAVLVLAAAAVVLLVLLGGREPSEPSPGVVRDDRARDAGPERERLEPIWSRRFRSPAERAALQRAIEQARLRRAAGTPIFERKGPPEPTGKRRIGKPAPVPEKERATTEPRGTLDKAYIREVVRDALPLLRECYEMALEEEPTLAGTLVVEFTIAGEPEIGGLVEEAIIPKEGPGKHAGMSECVRETLLSLQFPAPEGGGSVEVRYPFAFSSTGDPPPAPPPPAPPQPPPQPAPSMPGPLGTGENPGVLTNQARELAKSGDWAGALKLCEKAAALDPEGQDNAMVCALAGCNLHDRAAARRHHDRLESPSRRYMVRHVCAKNRVTLPAD